MMLKIGNYNTLKIAKETPQGLYLDSDQGEILLPRRYVVEDMKIGDDLTIFIYTDSEDRLVATSEKPLVTVGEFGFLRVKELTPFGAFMDWGLSKDLLVPHREQHRPMQTGEYYIIRACLDHKTQRVIGVNRISAFLEKNDIKLTENEKVTLLPYENTTLGTMCIINHLYVGMLYKNEIFKTLKLGSYTEGYIKKIREDQKIDLSLRLEGFDHIKDQCTVIIEKLKENGGILPFSDKSSPEEIKATFEMSKKTFKKLIGNLYKQNRIEIKSHEIRLKT